MNKKEFLKPIFKNKKILLGITGSIAAFKAYEIIRFLKEFEAEVKVVLSHGAENFVSKTTLETLSSSSILNGFWNHDIVGTHHISTARWADLILIAPITAHFIAKMATGFADDLLSTEILAFKGPIFIAPAMNPTMYSHPTVQQNIISLKNQGVTILGPIEGKTSCGEEGLGRMMEPEDILENLSLAFYPPKNKKVLITLGPTKSFIDPVRFISNRSSGKMGASFCWVALSKGYEVTAICGREIPHLPKNMKTIFTPFAQEMFEEVKKHWETSDIFISTAAVLDWDIANYSNQKIKKIYDFPQLEFKKNPDILKWVCENKSSKQFVLGFAAETDQPLLYAKRKLEEKGCDAIFANSVSKGTTNGFESDYNEGHLLTCKNENFYFEKNLKYELARKIFEQIETYYE